MSERLASPAAEASAFFREVARDGIVWTLRDRGGLPAPSRPDHRRVQPFWSSRARATRCALQADTFHGFEPAMITWPEFRDGWLPGLEREGMLIGINWSGPRAIGYDMEPGAVLDRLERSIQALRAQIQARAVAAGLGGAGLERRVGRVRREGMNGSGGRGGSGIDGSGVNGSSGRGATDDLVSADSIESPNRREASG